VRAKYRKKRVRSGGSHDLAPFVVGWALVALVDVRWIGDTRVRLGLNLTVRRIDWHSRVHWLGCVRRVRGHVR